eukprot:GHVS01024270.1.p1 GENE.GHVS01024270.1~~GHVS01024270.1.p1  ORF type:complete len:719 (+),score=88.94 GHVS01024270.1:184-2340(+)
MFLRFILRLILSVSVMLLIAFALYSILDECSPPTTPSHKLLLNDQEFFTHMFYNPKKPPKSEDIQDKKEFGRINAFLGDQQNEATFYPDYMRKNIVKANSPVRVLVVISDSEYGFRRLQPTQRDQMVVMFDTPYSWDYKQSFNITQFDSEGFTNFTTHGSSYGGTAEGGSTSSSNTWWRWSAPPDEQFRVKVKLNENMWRNNTALYLHVMVVDLPEQNMVSPVSSTLLSRPLVPALLKKARRYLLHDITGRRQAHQMSSLSLNSTTPVESIPPRVEIGVVVEHRKLSENSIKKQFGSHSSMLGYNSPYDQEYPYLLPVLVNNFVSPRDEYLPLTPIKRLLAKLGKLDVDVCPVATLLLDDKMKEYNIANQTAADISTDSNISGGGGGVDIGDGDGGVLREKWRDVRNTEIEIIYKPASYSYWFLLNLLSESFSLLEHNSLLSSYDVDSLKLMLSGASPVVLCIVYAVAFLHLVFQTISIGSDIVFWRKLSSYRGFSANALFLELLMGAAILLYLRNEGDSRLVQFFLLARLVLLLWKITKIARPRVGMYRRCCPYITLESKLACESKGASKMDALELAWLRRLFISMLPVLLLVSVYQLVFVPQRGWYSWLLKSLAACAYMGGFVAMTPQVYRNYLLKSVDHLPWTVLFYQFLNTFVDDLFALLIRMPNMHKMSVLRDDVVFICFLYQRWLYRGQTPRALVEVAGEEDVLVDDHAKKL